jgi:Uma2 family endonuclease
MTKTVEKPRMPLQSAPIWPLSVAAYRALGEAGLIPKNTELLYGFVYRKMSKSPIHSSLAMRLARMLQAFLKSGWLVRIEQPITCVDSEPEPDVAAVRGTEQEFWTNHPHTAELVIEVCITSVDYDRSKLPAYAAAGVKECWFVLGGQRQIEVYRQPVGDNYTGRVIHGPGGKLASSSIPGFTVDLDALFTR